MVKKIPVAASVSAQSTLIPHLSHRRSIYTFPNPFFQRGWGNTVQARRELEVAEGSQAHPPQLNELINRATVEYVALCPPTRRFPLSNDTFDDCVKILLQNPNYGIIAVGKNTILLRRGADYQHGLRLFGQQSGVQITKQEDVRKAYRVWNSNYPAPP
jgi:hypothetical protein